MATDSTLPSRAPHLQSTGVTTCESAAEVREPWEWLLAPRTLAEFSASYSERRHLVIAREDRDYFQRLLGFGDLDQILSMHGVRNPDVQLVQKGAQIPVADYTTADGVVDARKAVALFNRGATLIFGQLQARVPALAQLCNQLTTVFSSRFQTNVYLTPPEAQGFDIHWDTHDVFVLQVSGSKRWRLYGTPIELPLRGQSFEFDRQPAGPVTAEFDLHAGDVLYIPRGLMHSAHSTVDHSLHVTLGLLAYTWTDLLVDAVCAAGLEEVALREALPLGFAREDFPADQRARLLADKLAILLPRLQRAECFQSAIDDLVAKHQPMFGNLLEQQIRRGQLGLHSAVQCRADALWTLADGKREDQVKVHFGGTQVDFPRFLQPALGYIKTHRTFRVSDLPDCVDDAGKVSLVQRLIQEGLVEQS